LAATGWLVGGGACWAEVTPFTVDAAVGLWLAAWIKKVKKDSHLALNNYRVLAIKHSPTPEALEVTPRVVSARAAQTPSAVTTANMMLILKNIADSLNDK